MPFLIFSDGFLLQPIDYQPRGEFIFNPCTLWADKKRNLCLGSELDAARFLLAAVVEFRGYWFMLQRDYPLSLRLY